MSRIILSAVIVFLISFTTLFAQDEKEVAIQKTGIMLKALNQNETIKERIKDNCVIAVLYNPQSEKSKAEKELASDALKENKNHKVSGKKIKVIEIPMDATTNLEKNIIIKKINAFWITTDLQVYINQIRESAKYNRVATLSLDPALVNGSMVALSSDKTANGYQLIVNMTEVHNLNMQFDDDLLSSAVIVQ